LERGGMTMVLATLVPGRTRARLPVRQDAQMDLLIEVFATTALIRAIII
jgi:hypothetical protein